MRTCVGIVAAIAALTWTGCGPQSGNPAANPQKQQQGVDAGAGRSQGDPKAGEKVFAENCVQCHGDKGEGNGPGAAALDPKPRNLTDPKLQQSHSDAEWTQIIRNGGPAAGLSDGMPAFNPQQLSDAQIRDVIAYVRTLKK